MPEAALSVAAHCDRLHKVASGLPVLVRVTMLVATEAGIAAIRTAIDRGDDWSAAMKLGRLVPGITDTGPARDCARTITAKRRPGPLRLVRLGQNVRL